MVAGCSGIAWVGAALCRHIIVCSLKWCFSPVIFFLMTSPISKFFIFYRIYVHAEAFHNARALVVPHETVAEHICNLVDSKPCHIWFMFAICIRSSCRVYMQKGSSALLSQEG